MGLVYGILYISLAIYPAAFTRGRGWDAVTGSLPFLGLELGIAIACGIMTIHTAIILPYIGRKRPLVKEDRLHTMLLGSVLLPPGTSPA